MEKLLLDVKRLGRIRKSQVEITPWMIFSGDSGMGKSYLAILVHYFFEVLLDDKRVGAFFENQNINYNDLYAGFHDKGVAFKVNKVDLETWLAEDAVRYVGYMINNKNLSAEIVVHLPAVIPDVITCTYEEEMIGMDNNVETFLKYALPSLTYRIKNLPIGLNEESPFAYFFRYYLIKALFGDYTAIEHSFVLPPSRGAVMTENTKASTGMFEKFLADKSYLESAKSNPSVTASDLVELMNKVMEGKVSLGENNQYKYIMEGAEAIELPLAAAASSIRELAPIQMMIDNVDISKVAVLFEEPEAHLHPAKQRLMADVISCMNTAGSFLQITTHSDFILRRLNELLALARIRKSSSQTFNEINSSLHIDVNVLPIIENISAYVLEFQADGSSHVVKQNLERGIPYSSFYDALKQSVTNKNLINDIIHKSNEDN